MHLYHLTLQRSTAVLCLAYGSFSGPKVHEIVLAYSSSLEVVRADEYGKLLSVGHSETFGQTRSLAAFRLTGSKRDYLIVGSDSGRAAILQFNGSTGRFNQIHCETFGKSGIRRIVPGQYVAADPRGRAFLFGAVEKQKFVYLLNRDAKENLTISSPLEAHKSNVICYNIIALDVGFQHPVFASLERSYEAPGHKLLLFYELDLGLNHVIRKQAIKVEETANILLAVPGGGDGPSGVLVCSHGRISYHSISRDHPVLTTALPHRLSDRAKDVLVVSTAMHKQRGMFFFLLCSERGDLFKVDLQWTDETVSEIRVKYFDTLPNAAVAMCVLRTGFLFAAMEYGDHVFFEFKDIGSDDDPAGGFSSSSTSELDKKSAMMLAKKLPFRPRTEPKNLQRSGYLSSLAPVLGWEVHDFIGDGSQQIATICGRGSSSSAQLLQRGFAVQEMAVSELPATPVAVFTVKEHRDDEYDRYIVVSFTNATLVLHVGETVEEVTDSSILGNVQTLAVALLGEDSMVQVHADGVRFSRGGTSMSDWKPPSGTSITSAVTNPMQLVVALSSGNVVYFELEGESGLLEEVERVEGLVSPLNGDALDAHQPGTTNGTVTAHRPCLALSAPTQRHGRGRFVAVSDGESDLVRVLAIDEHRSLQAVSVQALPAPAESLSMVWTAGNADAGGSGGRLVLVVGTRSGVMLRLRVDAVTGQISDRRSRFLGTRAVRTAVITVGGIDTCFALSTRSWLLHSQGWGRLSVAPLCCDALDSVSSFSSEHCPEGFVAVSGSALRILALESPDALITATSDSAATGVVLNASKFALSNTPRRLVNLGRVQQDNALSMVIVDADQRCARSDTGPGSTVMTMSAGKWTSSVHLLSVAAKDNPAKEPDGVENAVDSDAEPWTTVVHSIELEESECAISACAATFPSLPSERYVCVCVAKSLVKDVTPPLDRKTTATSSPSAQIRLYKLVGGPQRKLELVHVTPLEAPSYILHCFHGRILCGVGTSLRMYELGKKKLLKRSECRYAVPNWIVAVGSYGDRIFCGDVQDSVQMLQYKASENELRVFADDTLPRWITALEVLDYQTVFGADKFGNVFVLRLPVELQDAVDADPTGGKLMGRGSAAAHKVSVIACFYVGSMVQAVKKISLGGSSEVLLYATLGGAIGAFVPLAVRSDVSMLQQLEIAMRDAAPPLCGRSHLDYRSYYQPVHNVIDGDLVEQFAFLASDKQMAVAGDLERSPTDILRKLEDVRERML